MRGTRGQRPLQLVHEGGYDGAAAGVVRAARLAREAGRRCARGAVHAVNAGVVLHNCTVPARSHTR
jgi:hypothetical protein